MKEYEELIEALRYCADTNCTVCPRRVTEKCTIDRLCIDAANVIEKLEKDLKYVLDCACHLQEEIEELKKEPTQY